jgi:hypothetical protein
MSAVVTIEEAQTHLAEILSLRAQTNPRGIDFERPEYGSQGAQTIWQKVKQRLPFQRSHLMS